MNYLGIDLGGTNVKAVVCREDGRIIGNASVPTMADCGTDRIIAQIASCAELAAASAGLPLSEFKKAGIGIPGQLASPKGPVILAPNINWKNLDVLPLLQDALKAEVVIANDADCMALAESRFGAGRPFKSFLMLTLGTGVGGAIVADKKLFQGFGPCSGEFGYLTLMHGGFHAETGPDGSLEECCSSRGLCRIAKEKGFSGELCAAAIFAASENGDPAALASVELYTDLLSEALSGLVNILRPGAVILGGGITKAKAQLFDRVNAKLPPLTYGWPDIPSPKVLCASLSDDGGALGAASLAFS